MATGYRYNGSVIQEYQLKRLAEGAKPATINREVSTLQRSLNIAVRLNKLNRAPIFEKLKEDNVRQGFLGWNDFDKILAEVREQWRRNTIEFSFLVGWRFGRVRDLQWKHVFLNDSPPVIRTSSDVNTKKAPAPLPLNGRLLEIIQEQQSARDLSCAYVFHHNGRKIGNFRDANKRDTDPGAKPSNDGHKSVTASNVKSRKPPVTGGTLDL